MKRLPVHKTQTATALPAQEQTSCPYHSPETLIFPPDLVKMRENVQRIERWAHQFMTPHYAQALDDMTAYLDSLKQYPEKIERMLLQFLIEFFHNIKMILKEQNMIFIDDLVNERFHQLFVTCTHSIHDMKNWLQEMSCCCQQYRIQMDYPNIAVDTVKNYIKQNLKNNITRADLASLVYLHPDYLSHIFRKQTGASLREYIINQRILRAKYLLSHTTLNISVIALECGYDNAAYFSKIFKKTTGMTPKSFQADNQKKFLSPHSIDDEKKTASH